MSFNLDNWTQHVIALSGMAMLGWGYYDGKVPTEAIIGLVGVFLGHYFKRV